MKRILLSFGILATAVVRAAEPELSDVAITQLSNRLVEVSYTLSGARAIVTPVFRVDGEAIDMKDAVTLGGDVRRIVAPGARRFVWDPRTDWKGEELEAERLSVELRAWSVEAPPPKMVVDLDPFVQSSPSNVLFYVSEGELPGGVADARYRTTKLLMTLVPARNVRWRMGDGTAAGSKYVTLSKDFYISAFTFTQGQSLTALGTAGNYNTGHEDSAFCPVEPKYESLRKQTYGKADVPDGCWIKTLRVQTGLPFDLPSEFQWEYAMRGGAETLTDMNDYGWWGKGATWMWGSCSGNAAWTTCSRDGAHPVGLKKPNAFGVYDIVGNVREYTRTGYEDLDTAEERDPEGAVTDGNYVVRRSGRHSGDDESCQKLSYRNKFWYASENNNTGFRLVLPVDWN